MQKIYSHSIGQPVVRIQDGVILGFINDFIINTDTGLIVGFFVKTKDFFSRKLVLLTRDIREWKLKVYVDDDSVLADPQDLIRLKPIFDKQMSVFLKPVLTTDDYYLGRVYDFNFDLDSFKMINLYILKKILFFITVQRRIVPVSEIVEIKTNAVIVRSNIKLAKWRKRKIIDLRNFVFTPDPEPEPLMNKGDS